MSKKEKSGKKKLINSTRLIIWISWLLMVALISLQYWVNQRYAPDEVFSLPLETMAWGITVIFSGYVGTDRIAGFVRTKNMEFGASDIGNISNLRRVIFLLLALVIYTGIMRIFLGVSNAPLGTLILAYSGSAGVYAIGNKAIKVATNLPGKIGQQEVDLANKSQEEQEADDYGEAK